MAEHPWLERLACVGFVANGVLHLVIGFLALPVVAGDEQEQTDTAGTLQSLTATLMAHSLGVAVLCLRHSRSARSPSGRWESA